MLIFTKYIQIFSTCFTIYKIAKYLVNSKYLVNIHYLHSKYLDCYYLLFDLPNSK